MKTFHLNLDGENKHIHIQVPDDIETEREKAYASAFLKLHYLLNSANVPETGIAELGKICEPSLSRFSLP